MQFLKNNMNKLFTFLILVVVLASCKTKKTVVEQTVAKEAVVDNKAKEIIEKHYQNTLNFQTVSIRSAADYEDQKQSISISADIRIKKDEIIFDPSKGGKGIRLKKARMKLIKTE